MGKGTLVRKIDNPILSVHLPWGGHTESLVYLHESGGRLVFDYWLEFDGEVGTLLEVSTTDYEVDIDDKWVNFIVGECHTSSPHESDGSEFLTFSGNIVKENQYKPQPF
jgi:hypothetical protein